MSKRQRMRVPQGTTRKELLQTICKEVLAEVAAHPEKAFAAADLLDRAGLHRTAKALMRNARCRAKVGLYTGETPPNDAAITWGDGPIKGYAVPEPTYTAEMREVAKSLMP